MTAKGPYKVRLRFHDDEHDEAFLGPDASVVSDWDEGVESPSPHNLIPDDYPFGVARAVREETGLRVRHIQVVWRDAAGEIRDYPVPAAQDVPADFYPPG